MNILVDSSVFIDFLRSGMGDLPAIFDLLERDSANLYIPTIVITEIWAGQSMKRKSSKDSVERILRRFIRVDLDEKIAKKAGGLMRDSNVLDASDAIIAATVLESNTELATQNKKHFKSIKGLKFFNPQKS